MRPHPALLVAFGLPVGDKKQSLKRIKQTQKKQPNDNQLFFRLEGRLAFKILRYLLPHRCGHRGGKFWHFLLPFPHKPPNDYRKPLWQYQASARPH